jgi:hypothetical protein
MPLDTVLSRDVTFIRTIGLLGENIERTRKKERWILTIMIIIESVKC